MPAHRLPILLVLLLTTASVGAQSRRNEGAFRQGATERDQFGGGAHPRARNMPADEVLTRARAELQSDGVVVVDCSRTETFRCYAGADALRRRGFEQVSIYVP